MSICLLSVTYNLLSLYYLLYAITSDAPVSGFCHLPLSAVLRIHLTSMRIRILDPHWKKNGSGSPGHFFTDLLIFFNKKIIFFYSHILILKLDEPFRNEEIFIISLFSKVQILVLGVNKFFLQFLVDILPLRFGSVDPHIFADPDPESQNLTDPTDPDPKHCCLFVFLIIVCLICS